MAVVMFVNGRGQTQFHHKPGAGKAPANEFAAGWRAAAKSAYADSNPLYLVEPSDAGMCRPAWAAFGRKIRPV